MAPRGSESPRARRALTVAAALLAQLLLSSLPLTDAAAGSPSPAPAPAPLPLPPPPRQQQQHAAPGSGDEPRSPLPPVPGLPGARRPPPRAGPPAENSAWQRLNFGERFGIALAGVAVAMQVALGAFLCARVRQLRRAAAPGKAKEQELVEAAAASPPPA